MHHTGCLHTVSLSGCFVLAQLGQQFREPLSLGWTLTGMLSFCAAIVGSCLLFLFAFPRQSCFLQLIALLFFAIGAFVGMSVSLSVGWGTNLSACVAGPIGAFAGVLVSATLVWLGVDWLIIAGTIAIVNAALRVSEFARHVVNRLRGH
jgi:hypothetical protein